MRCKCQKRNGLHTAHPPSQKSAAEPLSATKNKKAKKAHTAGAPDVLTMKTLAALLVWFILSSAADVPTVSDRSDELLECKLLGFGDMLACSTCTSFAEIVADRSKPLFMYAALGTSVQQHITSTAAAACIIPFSNYLSKACCCPGSA